MKINLGKAIKAFYPSPSFIQIYFEAIANAIDADATSIGIAIKLESFDKPDSLVIRISDNGHGFTDSDFKKFSSLLEVESEDHKGLGRLVYLAYFNEIRFDSQFDAAKNRTFHFSEKFIGDSSVWETSREIGTYIEFKYFSGGKIKSYEYLSPSKLKDKILIEFFPLLFAKKQQGEVLEFAISLEVETPNPDHDFFSATEKFSTNDLPHLESHTIQDSSIDFFQNIEILYSISKDTTKPKSLITSICVDGRAIPWDLVSLDAIPSAHQMIFLFVSEFFTGKTNASRQRLELPDDITERNLRDTLRRQIGEIIAKAVPSVAESNKATEVELDTRYPHLKGYYPKNQPGLIVKSTALDDAQKTFFNDQRRLLECDTLDEKRYEKALELSARALMEYVIYRARIIEKLKAINPLDSESEIHRLIVPMRKTFQAGSFSEDVYNNNVWMLDDKYMSYATVLSDQTMSHVIGQISLDVVEDDSRPDITIVFSADPTSSTKVDVVVIELKKQNVKLAKKEEVVSQLRQRARKLLKYYPNKIDRIWFYGITEIDDEFRISLKEDQFKELFSHGNVFYKPQPIIVDDENNPFYVDLFILTHEAFINDAESRNSTFMRILKARIATFLSPTKNDQLLVAMT